MRVHIPAVMSILIVVVNGCGEQGRASRLGHNEPCPVEGIPFRNPMPGGGAAIAYGNRDLTGGCIWLRVSDHDGVYKLSRGDMGKLGKEISSFIIGPDTQITISAMEKDDAPDRHNFNPQEKLWEDSVPDRLDNRIAYIRIMHKPTPR